MKNLYNKIGQLFLCLLIVYLPFSELVGNILEDKTGIDPNIIYLITRWYGFAAIILFIWAVCIILAKKKKFNASLILAGVLIVLGFVSALFISPSLSQGLEGIRITLFGLVFYILSYAQACSKSVLVRMVNTYLIIALIVALWGIVERFLPLKYLTQWGLIGSDVVFGYGWHSTGSFYQSASLIGGPNQLGSYLLPAFFISATRINLRSKKQFITYLFLALILVATILLTQSRSAIVGLAAGLIVLIYCSRSVAFKATAFTGLGLAILFTLWFLTSNAQFGELLTHGASQTGHSAALVETIQELKNRVHEPLKLIFGAGVGTAGPIAIKYGGIISESWYLQVLLEIGILGLILYLIYFFFIAKELWSGGVFSLFYGLIAVLVTTLFLHTLSDNPSLTFTIFSLIGLSISEEQNG